MIDSNTLEGVHLFSKREELLYKPNAKKYYWHIPKTLRKMALQEGTVVRGNNKQLVVVTKVFREELGETGKKYAHIQKIEHFKKPPVIREATIEEARKLNRKTKKK